MAEYLRLVDSALQTPVYRYVHADTGRQVTLIGAIHIGEPSYYTALRSVIDDMEATGAAVQCEGSSLLRGTGLDLTEQEQEVMADLRRMRALEKRRVAELGWVGQLDGLGYPPRWQVVDLSPPEIMRRTGVETMRLQVQRMIRGFDWAEGDRRGLARLRLKMAIGFRILARNEKRISQAVRRNPADAVLLDERNALALSGVADTFRDVVLIWGAAHLSGLDAGLREQGMVRAGEPEWYTALVLPSTGAALWGVITGKAV